MIVGHGDTFNQIQTIMNHFTYIEEQFMEGINDLSDTEINAIQEFLEEQPNNEFRFKEAFIVYRCDDRVAIVCQGITMDEDYKVYIMNQNKKGEIDDTGLEIYELEYMSIHQIVLQLSLELPD